MNQLNQLSKIKAFIHLFPIGLPACLVQGPGGPEPIPLSYRRKQGNNPGSGDNPSQGTRAIPSHTHSTKHAKVYWSCI